MGDRPTAALPKELAVVGLSPASRSDAYSWLDATFLNNLGLPTLARSGFGLLRFQEDIMANRVSASMVLGGFITTPDLTELADIISDEGLSIEWDGEPFEPTHRTVGEPLELCAHEVAWGRLETLESWCVTKKLPFARWSGAYPGQWGPERVVFTGEGEPASYAADDDDYVVICRQMVGRLGSMAAILAHFEAADFKVPSLVVEGDPDNATAA